MQQFFTSYKERLNTLLFLGIILAIPFGYYVPESHFLTDIVGDFFLRSLSMLIVPIIVISMLSGILQFHGNAQFGAVGLRVVLYYSVTTAIAVATGLLVVNLIQPGKQTAQHTQEVNIQESLTTASNTEPTKKVAQGGIVAVLKKIVPKNIVQAAADGNILGLIFFATLLALAILAQGDSAVQNLKPAIDTLFAALLWLVDTIMLFAPLGVFALVSAMLSNTVKDGLFNTIGYDIFTYTYTVLLGLLLHACISLPLLLLLYRTSPIRFFKAMLPALSTAFSTASSAATLPVTIESLHSRAGVSKKVASFVAPLGATVNMDGTAIYEAIAVVFIANMYGIDLSFAQQFIIFITATFSAIGAAGIPGAGLVMMVIVLNSVGLPVEGISLIVIVDRLLDMFRTAINVWGDSIGAAVVGISLEKIEVDSL